MTKQAYAIMLISQKRGKRTITIVKRQLINSEKGGEQPTGTLLPILNFF